MKFNKTKQKSIFDVGDDLKTGNPSHWLTSFHFRERKVYVLLSAAK